MVGRNRHWKLIERWAPVAFLAAGGVWLLASVLGAVNSVIDSIAGVGVGTVVILIVFFGLVIAFVGLLGTYRDLVDPAPRLVGIGILVTTYPAVLNSIFLLAWVSDGVVPVPWPIPADQLLFALWSVSFLAFPTGPVLFGIATLRTAVFSRAVGSLFVVPGILWIVWAMLFASPYSDLVPSWPGLRAFGVVAGMIALAFLGIGYLLQTDGSQPEKTGRRAATE